MEIRVLHQMVSVETTIPWNRYWKRNQKNWPTIKFVSGESKSYKQHVLFCIDNTVVEPATLVTHFLNCVKNGKTTPG